MNVLVVEEGDLLAAAVRDIGHVVVHDDGDAELYVCDVRLLSGVTTVPRRPLVVVAAAHDAALLGRAIESGADAYLTRPVDRGELEAALAIAVVRRRELDAARQALADRKTIERAKGLLMRAFELAEDDAYRRLQHTARQRNLRLADVARTILDRRELFVG